MIMNELSSFSDPESMIYTKIVYLVSLVIAEILSSLHFKRRKGIYWRVPLVLVVYFLAVIYIPEDLFGVYIGVSINTISMFVLIVLSSFFLLKVDFKSAIIIGMSTVFTQHAGMLTYRTLQRLCFPNDDLPKGEVAILGPFKYTITLYIGYIISYSASYFFILRKSKKHPTTNYKSWQLVILLLFVLLMVYSIADYAIRSSLSTTLPYLASADLATYSLLYILFSTGRHNQMEEDEKVMKKLLIKEQKHYEQLNIRMNVINAKCHDLKYQIKALRDANTKDRNVLADQLQKDVSIYEEMVKTGNAALDNVISEKKFLCDYRKINLDFETENNLSFIDALDIYVLFGNALDNAIECVSKYKDEDKKISLSIRNKGELIYVRISNPCKQEIKIKDGYPITSKAEKESHGFGVKSMHMIVEKYNGNEVDELKDDKFIVNIIFHKIQENKGEVTSTDKT